MSQSPSRSPSSRGQFDLAVLGGGSAGFAAAIKGAEQGARVALVEEGVLGGTCVNVGCIPSKTLIRAAEAQHRRMHHGFRGIPASDGTPEWPRVLADKRELVERLRKVKYEDVLAAYPRVTLIRQRARLAEGHTLRLADGASIAADKMVIATGSSPWVAPIPGLREVEFLDSTTAMALPALPASLGVIGGGSVGLELAQTFARLGVAVTVIEAAPTLLPAEDAAIGKALATYLTTEGLVIHAGVQVERVDRRDGCVVHIRDGQGARDIAVDQLLVATGRRSNSADLGLEMADVRLGGRGEIVIDEHLRTSNPDVYAAGDVTGDPMFVYVAAYAGTLAAENALGSTTRRYDLSDLPRVTFTDPGVASVGWTEQEARARGIAPLVARLSMEHVPRALAARDTRGFVQLVADTASHRIIGAQILAPEAGEMISEVVVAMRANLTFEDIARRFHPYLTSSEGIKLAAQSFTRDVATLSCCAA